MAKTMIEAQIGFIGAGRMAAALAQGFITAGLSSSDRIVASDSLPAAAQGFAAATGCRADLDNRGVVERSDVVFLSVKPQSVATVLKELAGQLSSRHLLISIAAGVRLAALAKLLAEGANRDLPRMVRVMPNTPCLVGQSASGYCLGAATRPDDAELVSCLLNSVGRAYQLDESLLDAVTGLSGSGPAFVYTMIEALSDGGVRMGLPREIATALAAQTVKGAAEMVLVTGQHPGALKDQVTSPGGTTIAGLQALEQGGIRAALMGAVEAATLRSIELGKMN